MIAAAELSIGRGPLRRRDEEQALNRAVALAEVSGPAAALAEVDTLDLRYYQPFQVTRAELLPRLGRPDEAAEAYDLALALTANAVERAHLTRRRASLPSGSPGQAGPQ